MNASSLIYVGPGRVKTTGAAPTHSAPNAVPFTVDGICVQTMGGIANHVSGLPYGANGRIAIVTNATLPIRNYVGGLAIAANGRLACAIGGVIHHYVRGIPVTADGKVCIDAPMPAAQDEDEDDALGSV